MRSVERARFALWNVSVGWQLSALYTLLLAATLALLGGALYVQLDHFLVQDTATRLRRVTQPMVARAPDFGRERRGDVRGDNQLGGPVPFPLPFNQAGSVERTASFFVRGLSGPDLTVAVLDAEGSVITSTQAYEGGSPRSLPVLPAGWLGQLENKPDAQWVLPGAGGGRQLVVVQPVIIPGFLGSPDTQLFLLQAASLAAADAVLNQLRLYLVLGLLFGTIVGVFAGRALTRAVLKPLDRMARTSEAIAGGDLNRRLRLPPGRNEVARLAGAFDHMVDRLAATLEAQRRFVADASHELRTPLTSMEGLSEMLLMGADRGDTHVVQRTVRSIHGELGRLSRLVSDLLTLSRLDSAAPMSLRTVDAGKMLSDVAAQMTPLASAQQVRLEVEYPSPVFVQAEPDRLKQVILNLVDNAVRYTPPGGEVRLSAMSDPAHKEGRIRVQDTGPGIAAEDLPHIFERFYRGDPSRTRATGNSGLGLAIANAIVQAHGGTIEVKSAAGAGTCFTVRLPASRPGNPPSPSPEPQVKPAEEPSAVRAHT